MVRTRIAPSPTGYPHIGTMYQALFDYAYAKRFAGIFFVRIEDTDTARFVADAEEKIYAALDWLGLQESESPRKGGVYSPYKQSERLDIYKKYAGELVEKGGAYYCFCSKERLEQVHQKQAEEKQPMMYDKYCRTVSLKEATDRIKGGETYVIRLKIPEDTDIVVRDEIRGEIHFDSRLIEDTVLLKADGYPTYHLASSVIDDHLMKTTHVVRGEEWLSSLPKHWITYDYFGWEKPLFFHTPVLRNPDKSKLSKRHGHVSIHWYQEEGFLPSALLNYLSLMAWSHPEGKEIFSLDEFTSFFDLKDIKPVGPIFDLEKLKWMNGEYIRMTDDTQLFRMLQDFFKDDAAVMHVLTQEQIGMPLIALAKTRMKTLKYFKELVIPLLITLRPEEKEVAHLLSTIFASLDEWNSATILDAMRNVLKQTKVKGSVLYKIMTGREKGLPLPESLAVLGKEKTLSRLAEIKNYRK